MRIVVDEEVVVDAKKFNNSNLVGKVGSGTIT